MTHYVRNNSDLLDHIRGEHLKFLRLEDDTQKIEKLATVTDIVKAYLSSVKHNDKFPMPIFMEHLKMNVDKNPNFNALESGRAFQALEKYASNLINYPWRKEYKCIKLYNGFYKHNVSSHLIGADNILELMGYQHTDGNTLFAHDPTSHEELAEIALNCRMAACECEIMWDIATKVKGFRCTYKDIFKIRKSFPCDSSSAAEYFINNSVPEMKQSKKSIDRRMSLDKNEKNLHLRIGETGRSREDSIQIGQLVDLNVTETDSRETVLLPNEKYELGGPKKQNGFSSTKLSNLKTSERGLNTEKMLKDDMMRKNRSNSMDVLKPKTLDDHIEASRIAVEEKDEKNLAHRKISENGENWEYVYRTLEEQGYQRGYGDRGDIFQDMERTKSNTSLVNTEDNLASKRKPVKRQESDQVGATKHPEDLMRFDQSGYSYASNIPTMAAAPPLYNRFMPPFGMMPGAEFSSYGVSPLYGIPPASLYGMIPSNFPRPPMATSVAAPAVGVSAQKPIDSQVVHGKDSSKMAIYPQTGITPAGDILSSDNRHSYYDNVNMDDKVVSQQSDSWNSRTGIQAAASYPYPMESLIMFSPQTAYPERQLGTFPIPSGYPYSPINSSVQNLPPHYSAYPESSMQANHPKGDNPTGLLVDIGGSAENNTLKSKGFKPQSDFVSSQDPNFERSDDKKENQEENYDKPWSCETCTYLNKPSKEICEICSRSRRRGAESIPLHSGGRECKKCTLVNEKDALTCSACDENLKDSPTYI